MEQVAVQANGVTVVVDADSGTFDVLRDDGPSILAGAFAGIEWSHGSASSDAPGIRRRIDRSSVEDAIGRGKRVTLTWTVPSIGAEAQTLLTVYAGLAGFTAETILTNHSDSALVIRAIEPCTAVPAAKGCLYLPNAEESMSPQWARVLTNGYLYSDPGAVEVLDGGRPVTSSWVLGVRSHLTSESLVAGYLGHDNAETRLTLGYDMRTQPAHDRQGVEFHARSLYGEHVEISGGRSLSSGTLLVTWAGEPDTALQTYGTCYATANGIQRKRPLMGWCSWYYTKTETSEEEILENARFIADHLKDYGLDVVQVDDGYQRDFGDWEGNDRFPHGMGWLAEQIHDLGLRAGIWVAPYVIGEHNSVAREHRDWLGVASDGEPKRVQNIYGRGGYALDPTVPDARGWLAGQFDMIGREWGYDMVKIDFVEWSVLAIEKYRDVGVGRAGAYRLGQGAIRSALGEQRHILDCGPLTAAGISDSWRIELDFDELNWRQYTKEPFSNVPAITKRYYLHNHLWSNDPDHIGLAKLTDGESRSIVSVMALSGGTIISGDKLSTLPERKLDMLKRILPAYGDAARPLNLFGKETPTAFHLPITRPFGSWHAVGLFNWDENGGTRREVELTDLGLDPTGDYVAFGFWTQTAIPVENGRIGVDLGPGDCEVVAIRPRREHPIVVGTDRHVLQGAVELDASDWDESTSRLSGSATSVAGTRMTVTVSVPEGYSVKGAGVDRHGLAVGHPEAGLLPVCIPFPSTGTQDWWVEFEANHDA